MSDLFEAVIDELKQNQVKFYVTVPDSLTRPLIEKCESDPFFKIIRACHEAEAIAIASGIYLGGAKSIVVMENAGLFNTIEAMRAMPIDMKIPQVLLIGNLGKAREDDTPDETLQKWFSRGGGAYTHNIQQGEWTKPLLDFMGIPNATMQTAKGAKLITWALKKADEVEGPVAVILDTLEIWGV